MTTVYTTLTRDLGLSRKKIKRVHKNADPGQQVDFLQFIAPIDPSALISIDGMTESKGDFRDTYGWSKKGEPCVREQIVIGTRSFAVMCAIAPLG